MGTPYMIVAKGLRKSFGSKVAVDGIDLRVPKGGIHGLLGPNGAGKTTTMRMLVGLLTPDEGHVTLTASALHPTSITAKRSLGYLPEAPPLYEKLTGREHLELMGELFSMRRSTLEQRSVELRDLLELADGWDRMVETYSKGMKQKLALAQTLVHGPNILILDEPTNGLDPYSARVVKDLLLRVNARGVTILLSTHLMDIVEQLCRRISIVGNGKILAGGSVDEVKAFGGGTLEDSVISVTRGKRATGELKWLKG